MAIELTLEAATTALVMIDLQRGIAGNTAPHDASEVVARAASLARALRDGTDLDLQLRRRGISTILLGGISTNIGVESTAREAYDHGYQQSSSRMRCPAGARRSMPRRCGPSFRRSGASARPPTSSQRSARRTDVGTIVPNPGRACPRGRT